MPVIEDMFLYFGTPKSAPSPTPNTPNWAVAWLCLSLPQSRNSCSTTTKPHKRNVVFLKIKMKKKTFFLGGSGGGGSEKKSPLSLTIKKTSIEKSKRKKLCSQR